MLFRHSRKRGDLSTLARIRIEIIHWLKVIGAAAALAAVILYLLLSPLWNMPSGPPLQVPAALGTYNAHWHNDLCIGRNRPIGCSQATQTAVANPTATEWAMCCLN